MEICYSLGVSKFFWNNSELNKLNNGKTNSDDGPKLPSGNSLSYDRFSSNSDRNYLRGIAIASQPEY